MYVNVLCYVRTCAYRVSVRPMFSSVPSSAKTFMFVMSFYVNKVNLTPDTQISVTKNEDCCSIRKKW